MTLLFGLRAWGLTLDARELAYGTCGRPSCAPSETVVTGRGLNLTWRAFVGAELAGGLEVRPVYAQAGLAFGWDLGGTASIAPLDGRRVRTTGTVNAITGAIGVRPRWARGSVRAGLFLSWVTFPARRGDGDSAETLGARRLSWGLEAGFDNHLRRGMDLSTLVRVGADLSVVLTFGLSLEG